MRLLSLAIGLFGAVMVADVCSAEILDNPFSEYIERGVTISPGAGNANDANAAIHTIDPWSPYAGDTRIPGDARSVICALSKMYRTPSPFFAPLTSGATTGTSSGGNVSINTSVGAPTAGAGVGAGEGPTELSGCY